MGCIIKHDFKKPAELVEFDNVKKAVQVLDLSLRKFLPESHAREWNYIEDKIRKLFCGTKIVTGVDPYHDPLIMFEIKRKQWNDYLPGNMKKGKLSEKIVDN
jgi:hypothetical protein